MPATRNIEIYQGDTYAHQLVLKNNANAVINIASRTYSGQIRKRRSSDTISANFAAEITDGANGVVVFTMTPNDTANLRPGIYVYDFQEINGQTITTILTGNATITGEVTR
ncbi:hypothetical protein EB001_10640 [bacterium]|nr:hypothetical protein [bacterium]